MHNRTNEQLPFDLIKNKLTLDFDLGTVNTHKFAKNAKNILKKNHTPPYSEIKSEVFYDPDYLNLIEIPYTLYTRAARKNLKQLDELVRKIGKDTKHRLIFTEQVTGDQITNGDSIFDNSIQPYLFALTTTCAPNGMGSSPEDEATYFSVDELANGLPLYKEMMKLTYQRILYIQIIKGLDVVVIPPIGLGLYLNVLHTRDQKDIAVTASYQALRAAIESFNGQDINKLKQVICVMPNKNKQNPYYLIANQIFASIENKNPLVLPVELVQADFLEVAQKFSEIKNVKGEQKYKIGLVNPGTHAGVGGAYLTVHNDKLSAGEETIGQASNFPQIQAMDIRGAQDAGGNQYHQCQTFPPYLRVKSNHILKDKLHKHKDIVAVDNDILNTDKGKSKLIENLNINNQFSEFSHANFTCSNEDTILGVINAWLSNKKIELSSTKIMDVEDTNTHTINSGICFETEKQAQLFAKQLTEIDIRGHQKLEKTIHRRDKNIFIILTRKELQAIRNDLGKINTQSNSHINNVSNNSLFRRNEMLKNAQKAPQNTSDSHTLKNKLIAIQNEFKNMIAVVKVNPAFFSSKLDKQADAAVKAMKNEYFETFCLYVQHEQTTNKEIEVAIRKAREPHNVINFQRKITKPFSHTRDNLEEFIEKNHKGYKM